jgi:hypothetical protein
MPLTYAVDPALKIVFETWTGTVTAADLRASWERMMSDPEAQACGRHLADVRQATFVLTGAELDAAVRDVLLPRIRIHPSYSAMVAGDPVAYGTGRQFDVFVEAGAQMEVFTDYDAALEWLLKQAP